MKIIDGFEFISFDGKMMAVSIGDAADVYKGIINLNKTAYKIWKYIEDGLSIEETAKRLSDEYNDLSYDEAEQYVRQFVGRLTEKGIIVED